MGAEELNHEYGRLNQHFGRPCLVHATKTEAFLHILRQGHLLKPKAREGHEGLGISFIDQLLGLANCLFFKAGFAYNASKNMDCGFIFSLDLIDRHFEVFKIDLVHHCAKEMIRFWKKYEPEQISYLEQLGLKKELEEFFKTDKNQSYANKGYPGGYFRYWECVDKLERAFKHSRTQHKLTKHLLDERHKAKVGLMKKNYLKKEFCHANIRGAEIACHKNIALVTPQLIGFYCRKPSKHILALLNKYQEGTGLPLVLFDGKHVHKLPQPF